MFSFANICYLFLGGAGGGLEIVAGLAAMSIPGAFVERTVLPAYRKLMATVFGAASALLFLAALLLLADAGNPDALGNLFFAPRLSWMTVGAWALLAGIVLGFALVVCWENPRFPGGAAGLRALAALATAAGLTIVLYTGFLLADMRAVPLWNTGWLPVLFLLSSLSCGAVGLATLAFACGVSEEFRSFVRVLLKADVLLVVFEAICAALVVLSACGMSWSGQGGSTAQAGLASVLALFTGAYAWVWWGVFVLAGILATALLDVAVLRAGSCMPGRLWRVLGPLSCVAAGAFALRFCLIEAGMHPFVVWGVL